MFFNFKKKADDKTIEISNSLKAYLKEAKDGRLDYETLNGLIVALEGLKDSKNGNLESLNLSPTQLNTLIKISLNIPRLSQRLIQLM